MTAAGLLAGVVFALPFVAEVWAEPSSPPVLILPVGTTIKVRLEDPPIVVDATLFAISREALDKSNAAFQDRDHYSQELAQCRVEQAQRADKKNDLVWPLMATIAGLAAVAFGAGAVIF